MSDENLLREGTTPDEVKTEAALEEGEMLAEIANSIDEAAGEDPEVAEVETEELVVAEPKLVTEEVKEEEPPESISSGWAAIRKADKRLRGERDELRRMRHELQQARETSETQSKSQTDIIAALKANPLEFLESQGIPFDKLAEQVIDGTVPDTTVNKLEERFNALETENKQLREQYTATQQEKLVGQFRSEVQDVLSKDNYSLLSAYPNAVTEVETYASQYYSAYGEALPIVQIADILQDRWREQLSNLSSNQAARKALGLSIVEDNNNNPSDVPAPSIPRQKTGKTLTRKHSSNLGTSATKNEDLSISSEEELTEAAKLIPDDIWEKLEGV